MATSNTRRSSPRASRRRIWPQAVLAMQPQPLPHLCDDIFLFHDAAAQDYQGGVEDMDEADEAPDDFGNPPIHQRPHPIVLQTGKNLPSVVELRKPGPDALHQSGSGGVPLIAAAEHVPSGIPVLGMDQDAAEFPGGEPRPQVHLAVNDDGAAHAGSVCEAQEIRVSPPGAVMGLTGGGAVHIVLYADGDMESGLQDFPDICAGITGDILICVQEKIPILISVFFIALLIRFCL